MNFLDIIRKKRDGERLSDRELDCAVEGYVKGEIPDRQMSAFLMAVYFNSLDKRETAQLTKSMASSGEQLDLSSVEGFKVDKHSTGGVGDTVTLILLPLVAATGLKMGKLSGRGLGHTGGTIDKLESIPGFKVNLTKAEFLKNLKEQGLVIMEHTSELVPADEKLYRLRNCTATVESLPLIVSSIMSKKIACDPDGLSLDVKVGNGAFMQEISMAETLAEACLEVGQSAGLKVTVLLTDMNQPLGRSVGNALEVKEAIKVLRNETKGGLRKLSLHLAAELLLQSPLADTRNEGLSMAEQALCSGKALRKFEELVESQDGNPRIATDLDLLPKSKYKTEIRLDKDGFVSGLEARKIGQAANLLGAGRKNHGKKLDHSVGIRLNRKVGDEICSSNVAAWVHHSDKSSLSSVQKIVKEAFTVIPSPSFPPPLIKKRLT